MQRQSQCGVHAPNYLSLSLFLAAMDADMSELKLEKGCELDFYNGKDDLMNFRLRIKPDDGIYRNGVFVFNFKVPTSYPHDAPKVLCETTVFHPNIDMEGHVCLNILREDWKPVRAAHSLLQHFKQSLLTVFSRSHDHLDQRSLTHRVTSEVLTVHDCAFIVLGADNSECHHGAAVSHVGA
eukprot:scaffold39234_cov33-Tisochrysis_lutea.AAC.1